MRVDIQVKEGASAPALTIFANRLDEPKYMRRIDSNGEEAVLEGLGAGRFRIMMLAQGGAGGMVREEIELDGESEIVRTYDAR